MSDEIIEVLNTAKEVRRRLLVLTELDNLAHPLPGSAAVRERELQRLIEGNPWLFGSRQIVLTGDRGLTTVLTAHGQLLGRAPTSGSTVRREDGTVGRPDLVVYEGADGTVIHYTVIEIKAPDHVLDMVDYTQLHSYATTIARDSRFDHDRTRWTFTLLGTSLVEGLAQETRQRHRPPGLVSETDRTEIWVRTWRQLIDENRQQLTLSSTPA